MSADGVAAVPPERLRETLRQVASGVTVVGIRSGERVHGLTVTAFLAVSVDPPLVAVSIDRRHRAARLLDRKGAAFAVNLLRDGQRALAERFATADPELRFAEGRWRTAVTGAPVLADALAWLDCDVVQRIAAGSHRIVLGAVRASAVPCPGAPLVYFDRAYRTLDGARTALSGTAA